MSKNLRYESLYCVIGTNQHTGLEIAPKDIQNRYEILERGKLSMKYVQVA